MKFFPLLAVLGIFALVGCGRNSVPSAAHQPTPEPAPQEDPHAIRMGLLLPLHGAQATFGQDALRGAQLAAEEINAAGGVLGHPLVLRVKDTASLPENTATAAADAITNDAVALLIGEIASDRTLVAARVAQEHGIPLITPASTNENITPIGDFIFRACYTDSFQAVVMAKFARSIKVEKAAILFDPSNAYSAGLAEIFRNDFKAAGGTITAEETYRAGDPSFARQLDAIRATNPEVVFLPSYYGDAAPIIREARQAGLDMPFLGTDGWDSPEFLRLGGEAATNCYFSGHFSAESKDPPVVAFVERFTRKFQTPPPPLATLAYDTVRLAADALERAATTEASALRDALAATKDFPGVTGKITFDAHRNPSKNAVITRVENGQFTYLETVRP